MPYIKKRKTARTRRNRTRKYGNLSKKKAQNMTTELRWFKFIEGIGSDNLGNIRKTYDQADLPLARQFDLFANIWEEFKVLKVMVTLMPANIGGESFQTQGNPPSNLPIVLFRRGNAVTWIDPNAPSGTPPTTILDVMGRPSSRLFQPRRFHKRWMSRPSGLPDWGQIDDNGAISTPDQWHGSINLFGTNFTPTQAPGSQVYWYVTLSFKVLFRSRKDT